MSVQDEEEIFTARSTWGETCAAVKQWHQGAAMQLRVWSTAIQEVEGRHGMLYTPEIESKMAPWYRNLCIPARIYSLMLEAGTM